jgi:RLL motif-containing protein 1
MCGDPSRMLCTRLEALSHPVPTLSGSSAAEATELAAWLEDRFLRQLPMEGAARGALRSGAANALPDYLEELGAPSWVKRYEQSGNYVAVCSWLVNAALQYEYGDNSQAHEDAAAKAASTLKHDDPELVGLAEAMQVGLVADAASTLQAVVKAARSRPRPTPPAPLSAPKRLASDAPASRKRELAPLEGLGDEVFPFGFSLEGTPALNDAARVLRMLHVRELRRMQDGINAIIACMQDYTANPKTDSKLGRVGR